VGIHAQVEREWAQTIGPQHYQRLRQALAKLMGPDHNQSSSA
jgi:hypothetical protein